MNCKQGDLAVYIGPDGLTIRPGCFVICLKFKGKGRGLITREADDFWFVEYNGRTTGITGLPLACRDAHLRPIRDNDGQDETLTWAGKPHGMTA